MTIGSREKGFPILSDSASPSLACASFEQKPGWPAARTDLSASDRRGCLASPKNDVCGDILLGNPFLLPVFQL